MLYLLDAYVQKLQRKAASNDPQALYQLGRELLKHHYYQEAFRNFDKAAGFNHPKALFEIGWRKEKGLYGEAVRPHAAREMYERAAQHGSVSAHTRLGWMKEKGLGGFTQDEQAAAEEYRQALYGDKDGAAHYHLAELTLPSDAAAAQKLYMYAATLANNAGQSSSTQSQRHGSDSSSIRSSEIAPLAERAVMDLNEGRALFNQALENLARIDQFGLEASSSKSPPRA